MVPTPRPFRLEIPDQAIADLKARLALTRLPDQPPGEPWATGTDVDYLGGLLAYWQTGFNWRHAEARLADLGFEVVGNSPEEFAAFQQAEIARWKRVVTQGGITAE